MLPAAKPVRLRHQAGSLPWSSPAGFAPTRSCRVPRSRAIRPGQEARRVTAASRGAGAPVPAGRCLTTCCSQRRVVLPDAALAVTTGLEPAISTLTGWRALRLPCATWRVLRTPSGLRGRIAMATGLEPARTRSTIWCSAAELRHLVHPGGDQVSRCQWCSGPSLNGRDVPEPAGLGSRTQPSASCSGIGSGNRYVSAGAPRRSTTSR